LNGSFRAAAASAVGEPLDRGVEASGGEGSVEGMGTAGLAGVGTSGASNKASAGIEVDGVTRASAAIEPGGGEGGVEERVCAKLEEGAGKDDGGALSGEGGVEEGVVEVDGEVGVPITRW